MFGIGDVDELVKLLREGPAAAGLVAEARGEMDPRKIQAMGALAPSQPLVEYHHLVRRASDLIEPAQSLVDAGCNYIVFSDEGRHANENMKRIMDEVIPSLRESG